MSPLDHLHPLVLLRFTYIIGITQMGNFTNSVSSFKSLLKTHILKVALRHFTLSYDMFLFYQSI